MDFLVVVLAALLAQAPTAKSSKHPKAPAAVVVPDGPQGWGGMTWGMTHEEATAAVKAKYPLAEYPDFRELSKVSEHPDELGFYIHESPEAVLPASSIRLRFDEGKLFEIEILPRGKIVADKIEYFRSVKAALVEKYGAPSVVTSITYGSRWHAWLLRKTHIVLAPEHAVASRDDPSNVVDLGIEFLKYSNPDVEALRRQREEDASKSRVKALKEGL